MRLQSSVIIVGLKWVWNTDLEMNWITFHMNFYSTQTNMECQICPFCRLFHWVRGVIFFKNSQMKTWFFFCKWSTWHLAGFYNLKGVYNLYKVRGNSRKCWYIFLVMSLFIIPTISSCHMIPGWKLTPADGRTLHISVWRSFSLPGNE